MKRKKIKDRQVPVKCSFCKVNQTETQIQGGSHGGRSVCESCWPELKAEHDRYEALWDNREESEAEYSINQNIFRGPTR